MAYADYTFYKETYLGTMEEDVFSPLVGRASDYIDGLTFGMAQRYEDREDLLKKATCAVCDAIRLNEKGGGIVSETVGKITRNYGVGISNTLTEGQRLYEAAARYLLREGLFYLGVE